MVILDIILRHQSPVHYLFLGQEVHRVGFLQQGVAHVLLVGEHFVDHRCLPFRMARDRGNAIRFQYPFNSVATVAL